MSEKLYNVKKTLSDKLSVLSEMEDVLKQSLSKNRDRSWGVEIVKEIGVYFDRLKALDRKGGDFVLFADNEDLDAEFTALAGKLQRSMKSISNLLAVLQIKIKGGQGLVRNDLRKLSQANKISGYKKAVVQYK